MTFDPAAAYRTTQITTASPAARVVLLYQGAIRQALANVAALERRDIPAAHAASVRAQEIVVALRGALDHSVGPIAGQLDQLYAFMLDRLVAGNVAKDPQPAREVLGMLRELLPAWQAAAAQSPSPTPVHPAPPARNAAGTAAVPGV